MDWQTIKIEGEGEVLHLVLNRPGMHNAINQQLLQELLVACATIEAQGDCRCVIVRGAGPSFSSGADLKEGRFSTRMAHGDSTGQALHRARLGSKVINALGDLTPVTIAAVHGHAIGGGACLAMACDFRIGAEGASVAIRESKLGLSLSWHSIPNVVHLVGPSRAKEMIMFGEPHPARQLLEWGFFNELVPESELISAAEALAAKVVRQPPIPVQMTKASVNALVKALDRSIFHLDAPGVTLTSRTRDAAKARAAFFEGETPDWDNE